MACCFIPPSPALLALDWPQYRGGGQAGVSPDRIHKQWQTRPPREIWRLPSPGGFSSFAISGGRAFTQVLRVAGGVDKEVCVAIDADSGAELWASTIGSANYDSGAGSGDGPRSTPSVADGRVFVLSSHLVLHCLDAADGRPLWNVDLRARYGGSTIEWQSAASALVDGDRLFINCNTTSQSLFALRTADGGILWRSQDERMTHATPVLATIHGVAQVVFATQKGLVSLNRADGGLLWKTPYPFKYTTSLAASPVVHGDVVVISANYTMGAYAARIHYSNGAFTAAPLWTNATLRAHWMTPVARQGFLYGQFGSSASSPLKCVDIQTGAQKWSVSGFGRGGTVLVDDHLLALAESGELVVIEPNPEAYTEVARYQAFDNASTGGKCWNSPAVADGRIYARSTVEAVCLDAAIPSLQLLAPRLLAGNRVQLWVGTSNGEGIAAERLPQMRLRWSSDLRGDVNAWTPLPNSLVLTNGQVRVDDVDAASARFYVVTELP
jgi:outer membrane protein assembly factor BamB